MDFKEATDQTAGCITLEELAQAMGFSGQSLRVARLARDNPGYRPPPDGWRSALARLARERAARLVDLADQLEREAES